MGYSERFCQLCGISFNVGRIRTSDETVEAAWNHSGQGVVEGDVSGCKAEGCSNVTRILPEHVYHDGSVRDSEEICEHIAGPACTSTSGYSGYRISLDEMIECTYVQCLMSKTEDWHPESSDYDFELEASESWLTGISKGPADEFEIQDLVPKKHGISDTLISNCSDPDIEWGTPMHPYCFNMFKRMSLERLGKVAIDGLRQLWLETREYCIRFPNFPSQFDVDIVSEQWYDCVPGTEYLVAHPLRIPLLDELIQDCHVGGQPRKEVVFVAGAYRNQSQDRFARLSPELKLMIMLLLGRQDVANLRLSSRCFQQIPQSYFRQLVLTEMPWIAWDIETTPSKELDWYKLWCRSSAADGGSQTDEVERAWNEYGRWPDVHWDKLVTCLNANEQQEIGDLNGGFGSADQKEKMEDLVIWHRKAGRRWPKTTEIRGLRNRRRIYKDIEEVLRRIAAID